MKLLEDDSCGLATEPSLWHKVKIRHRIVYVEAAASCPNKAKVTDDGIYTKWHVASAPDLYNNNYWNNKPK